MAPTPQNRFRCTWLVALAALIPGIAGAQMAGPTAKAAFTVTSSSEEARAAFWSAWDDYNNIFFARSAQRLDRALSLDPDFGLARVLHAAIAPNYTPAQQQAEFDRGVAAAAKASAGEGLVALAWREWFSGRISAAQSLMHAAADMFPDDPRIGFHSAWLASFTATPPQNAVPLRSAITKFPDAAPAYNILAYQLWQSGDHAGGLSMAQEYVRLAGDQPNAHDTYAELVQWDGRYDDAAMHYQRAIQLDSAFAEAFAGLAEVRQLQGRGAEARALYMQAIAREPARGAQLNHKSAIAISYLEEGNRAAALSQFAAVARDAVADSNSAVAAQAHRRMAVVEAVFGDKRAIPSHLAMAATIGGADAPGLFVDAAFAYASVGQLDSARAYATKLSQAASRPNAGQLPATAHATTGFVALQAGDPARALQELVQADTTAAIVQVTMAESHKKLGHQAEARAGRAQVMSSHGVLFYDAVARLRAKKL